MIALALLACGPAPLADGFEADLTETGGCGDVYVYARDPDHTVGIVFTADADLVSSVPEEADFDLTSADAATGRWLTAYQGTEVGELWCNDVSTGAGHVARSWIATGGTVHVAVTPQDYGGAADVTITDATFAADDDATVTVDVASFAWTGISIGWLPG